MHKTFSQPASRIFLLLIVLVISSRVHPVFSQTIQFSGTITEHEDNDPIPGATLHILGTSRGARTNADGRFHLLLDSGMKYSVRITALGYRPDTLHIQLFKDRTESIQLTSVPILGPQITISADASRKEARRIMHKVIDSKDAWQSEINNYKFDVYSKTSLRSQKGAKKDNDGADDRKDTNATNSNILAIVESSADGYWKRDAGYAEHINARKQTADIPANVNRIALVGIQNFYNDRLDFADYNIVSPVAHDAFDRYDYDLLGEGEMNGAQVYKISVEPLGDLNPAFKGTLWIDKVDYTIAYLDLQPNDAIKIGPVKGIDIRQTFTFVDNKFWMPSELNFDCGIKLELPIIPEFLISQSATLQNYIINGNIPDSIFSAPRHVVAPTADSVDSIHWAALRTIPLERDEDTAYRTIDSAVNNFKSSPTSFTPLGLLWQLFPGTDFFQFNRIDCVSLELGHLWTVNDMLPFTFGGDADLDIPDGDWEYSMEVRQALTTKKQTRMSANISLDGDVEMSGGRNDVQVTSSVDARYFDERTARSGEYDQFVNTLTSLFLHKDYQNYYEAHGIDINYSFTPNRRFSATLDLKDQSEHSLGNVTNFSLFFRKDTFQANPRINDGQLHEISVNLNENFPLGFLEGSIHEGLMYSNSAIRSDFNYLTSEGRLTLEGKLGGWGKTWLSASWNDLLSGALPAQDLFFFDARDAVIAPRDVFRTLSPFEFQGDRTWTVQFEQNFYDLPTRVLGIHMPIDLHWFGFANMAEASLSSATQALLPAPVQTLGSTPFTEAGFGVGNILNVLRFDAAWRLDYKTANNFYVTGTLAISF
jgi:hypothetical protein